VETCRFDGKTPLRASTFADGAIAALAGLAPIAQDSGKRRGQRCIEGGRAVERCALYMATLVVSRHNSVIRAFDQCLVAAGKVRKLTLTAAMRKLLVILNALLRDGVFSRHLFSAPPRSTPRALVPSGRLRISEAPFPV
jgi:transposase